MDDDEPKLPDSLHGLIGMYAVLDENKKVVPVGGAKQWGAFSQDAANREVGFAEVGGMRVSTVFLGINHSFVPGNHLLGGPPLWFETMIFGDPYDGLRQRYSTWEEADLNHKVIVLNLSKKRDPRCKKGFAELLTEEAQKQGEYDDG